jgi:hypothetical protein
MRREDLLQFLVRYVTVWKAIRVGSLVFVRPFVHDYRTPKHANRLRDCIRYQQIA